MNNNSSSRRQKQKRKKPTVRQLLIADEGERFTKEAKKMVMKDANVTFVGAHSRLVSRRMKELSTAEHEAYQRRIGEWVEKGPPPSAQRR